MPEDLALRGGEWVQRGAVRVWRAPAEAPAPPPPTFRVDGLLACPTCHARIDQLCKTTTGRHREPHGTRIVPKRCACGAAVDPGKKVCQDCRTEARRANARRSMRRTRARRRAARLATEEMAS